MLPLDGGTMAVFKSTGAYIIQNASDQGGSFRWGGLIQEAKIAAATHAVELNGTAYVSNTDGLFALKGDGTVEELSLPVRGEVTAAYALTTDYQRQRIILGSLYALDLASQRWLKYSGSDFHFETRALRGEDGRQVAVDAVRFEYDRTAETTVTLSYDWRVEERDWQTVEKVPLPYGRGTHNEIDDSIRDPDTGQNFQLRLADIPSTVKLRRIWVRVAEWGTNV